MLKYLAYTAGVFFNVVNMHAGISFGQIETAVNDAEQLARKTDLPVWLFWDEINTSALCSGVLADIVCRSMIHGRRIDRKVISIAACNPYRKRKIVAGAERLLNTPGVCMIAMRITAD